MKIRKHSCKLLSPAGWRLGSTPQNGKTAKPQTAKNGRRTTAETEDFSPVSLDDPDYMKHVSWVQFSLVSFKELHLRTLYRTIFSRATLHGGRQHAIAFSRPPEGMEQGGRRGESGYGTSMACSRPLVSKTPLPLFWHRAIPFGTGLMGT